ncbi:hypothetical protein HAX54_039552, partial [Datura stramonium]|nr:hypothetical protein [Datura stramonium]
MESNEQLILVSLTNYESPKFIVSVSSKFCFSLFSNAHSTANSSGFISSLHIPQGLAHHLRFVRLVSLHVIHTSISELGIEMVGVSCDPPKSSHSTFSSTMKQAEVRSGIGFGKGMSRSFWELADEISSGKLYPRPKASLFKDSSRRVSEQPFWLFSLVGAL